ncbi:MAG: amidohydrolase family protein [Chloroflexi bacterium]|nr:amidohydrolase family protein [Chloroflexota bacterium]
MIPWPSGWGEEDHRGAGSSIHYNKEASMADHSFIDIHIHTYTTRAIGMQAKGGGPGSSGYAGTMEELLPYMAELGMTHAAMMNFTPVADMVDAARARLPKEHTPAQRQAAEEPIRLQMVGRVQNRNVWTCDLARANPNLIAFIGVDTVMDAETMASEVYEKHKLGARGIKLHPEVQRISINDPRLYPAYRAAQETGMVILTHTGAFRGTDGSHAHPAMAADLVRAFPNLKLILAHLGGGIYQKEALQVADAFPQLLFDCCGSVRPREGGLSDGELVALFRRIGIHRILYGSDWASGDPAPDLERISRLPMSEEEKRMLLRGNAESLLEL